MIRSGSRSAVQVQFVDQVQVVDKYCAEQITLPLSLPFLAIKYAYNEHKSRARVQAIPKACGSGRRSELNLNFPRFWVLYVAELLAHAHFLP
jgi:hypothetical protein